MPDESPENTEGAPEGTGEAEKFDYSEPAELFTRAGMIAPALAADGSPPEAGAARAPRRKAITYRRFPSGAEAIRYAIEELPPAHLPASVLVVNGDRHEGPAIQELYDSADYPLRRRAPAKKPPRAKPNSGE
jgi:hypothetical protein